MKAEFENQPFGGTGQLFVTAPQQPATPVQQLAIEPPPWSTAMDATFSPGEDQQSAPIERPTFTAPDWEAEARERQLREQAERMRLDEPANTLDTRPARPEAKP
jgi:hypothetical protein